ncbi:MAG: hypothetical protein VCC04_10900 [Myxococcota bacterium]
MTLFTAFDFGFPEHCADSARARSCRVALGALLSILLIVPATALADYDRDHCRVEPETDLQKCITKPHHYVRHWDNGTVQCVHPSLHGSAVGTLDSQEGRLHHTSFDLAWVVSHQNLENWLEFRCRYFWRSDKGPADLWAAIADNIGYVGAPLNGLFSSKDIPPGFPLAASSTANSNDPDTESPVKPGQYVVFKPDAFEDRASFQVPTYSFWFQLMEDEYDFIVPLDVQKLIIKEYSKLRFRKRARFNRQYDYWGVYARLTGCTPRRWHGPEYAAWAQIKPDGNCQLAPHATSGIGQKVHTDPEITTGTCMKNLRENFPRHANTKTQAAWVRIALDFCHDVTSNNTGNGLGWSPFPNAQLGRSKWNRQTVAEKLTAREFVIWNQVLEGWREGKTRGRGWAVFEFFRESEKAIDPTHVDYRDGFPSK